MINIVIGKPGSGKTYHMVRYLYEVLVELLKKENQERKIYTNIAVNIDEFNRQLSEHFKTEVDVSQILIILDSAFLQYDPKLIANEDRLEKRVAGRSYYSVKATSKAFFWNRFEDNALILIDEIQRYLSDVKEVSDSERQSLIEYFSLHRHRRHDWFFITQNLLSMPTEIRRVSEKVYNVFNAKSINLGFPINIPMRDIETLLAGFNVYHQVYRIREGYLEQTFRVVYEDSVEVVVMEKRVFRLYQTHTQLQDNSSANIFRGDSTLPFDLGKGQRLRALAWFFRKHGFHLGVKVGIVVWFLAGLHGFFAKYSKPKKPKNEVIASESDVLPVSDAVFIPEDEPLEEITPEPPLKLPEIQHSFIIYNAVAIIDGRKYNVGDIYKDRRIKDIKSRTGIIYEAPELQYLRDFAFLRDVRLQVCGTNDEKL